MLDNVAVAGATSSNIFPNNTGNYAFGIIMLNGGCSDTSNIIAVSVNLFLLLTMSYTGNTTFCIGNDLLLTANSGSGLSYEWFYNGFTTGVTTINFNATASGNYSVKVTNNNNCYLQ